MTSHERSTDVAQDCLSTRTNERQAGGEPNPPVSVVMAVHNGLPYLREAVDSILAQTFRGFEFIIIEDGSTDGSIEVLEAYAAADARVRLLPNPRNLGLTRSLNIGLRAARGRYVARMDADDVSLPDRLARQLAFLDGHPDFCVVGTAYDRIDENGRRFMRTEQCATANEYDWTLMFSPPLQHPTAMFRRSLVTDHGVLYDESLETTQDYDYWVRARAHGKGMVLAEPLVMYRTHGSAVSLTKRDIQLRTHRRLAVGCQLAAFPDLTAAAEDIEALGDLMCGQRAADGASVRAAVAGMNTLLARFHAERTMTASERRYVHTTACRWLTIAMMRSGALKDPRLAARFVASAWRILLYAPYEAARYARRRLVRGGAPGIRDQASG